MITQGVEGQSGQGQVLHMKDAELFGGGDGQFCIEAREFYHLFGAITDIGYEAKFAPTATAHSRRFRKFGEGRSSEVFGSLTLWTGDSDLFLPAVEQEPELAPTATADFRGFTGLG